MKAKKLGRPALGGPRIQVRFNDDSQLDQLEKVIEKLNKKCQFGQSITRNGFIVHSVMSAIRKAK